jgi:DNA (cytosine-5)-methyltransferase 1
MKLSAIDIFCGIGGLSYGLKKAGIPVVAGIDSDAACAFAYEENIQADFLSMDVSKLHGAELSKRYWSRGEHVKILVGCAPCQPFSTHTNKLKNKRRSKRWRLIAEFQRIIAETNPNIVSMENVPNLANQKIFKDFVAFLTSRGFHVSFANIFCPDYGIPQRRLRLVLLASRMGPISLIPKTHVPEAYVTLRDAIGRLPPVRAGGTSRGDPLHRAQRLSELNLKRIRASKPNGTWLDWDEDLKLACHKSKSGKTYKAVYGRMAWNEPSSTITTQFYSYGTGRFGHPTQSRALTIREAAILQTFPLKYRFVRSADDIVMKRLGVHIGNAVPVQLGYIIGKSIIRHLGGRHAEQ